MTAAVSSSVRRRSIALSGVVQGVGFRPFVHGLASRLGLCGSVRNGTAGVRIEVEGDEAALELFLDRLVREAPPLARVESLRWSPEPARGETGFRIEESRDEGKAEVFIAPDVAPCADCLRELSDPGDRRFRYPFLNCTNCGPRFTIVTGAPYDRERTSMAGFGLCADCRREYEDPTDRRFHAQPTACPACGPSLRLLDAGGNAVAGEAAEAGADPVEGAARLLLRGQIGALKGVGGYHLACDARREAIVAELRRRKARDEKPFALMVPDLAAAEQLCSISAEERALLLSAARPIVLLRRRPGALVAASVAPRNPQLGVMLPYAPLHHLLLREVGVPLVLTSGNRADEPIACQDQDALERLSGIADFFLVHDRPIHTRCDDSVLRVVAGRTLPLRRSRGYAPLPITLPLPLAQPALALGGQLKSTFALGQGRHGFLSHHLGDLDHWQAYRAYRTSIDHYRKLYRIEPRLLVHDLHPDYASTRAALELAGEGLALFAVQHHHAHFASCLTENGFTGRALGVCFDGTGYGSDGTIWGGEFLFGDAGASARVGHLFAVPMPGGEQAIREPWRMAVSWLRAAGEPLDVLEGRVDAAALRIVLQLLTRSVNSPSTSSMGRLFDAAAAIACGPGRVSYEGQAAIGLEWLATGVEPAPGYPFQLVEQDGRLLVDCRPLIAAVARDARRKVGTRLIARRFHTSVVELIARTCLRLRDLTGVRTVALSGGVFMNAILSREAAQRLEAAGMLVLRHQLVPPNDGGLSLGQLGAAAARRVP